MIASGDIDLLSFTGGPAAGLALKNASGLVRCLMELGGNDPLIVMPDADLDRAAQTAIGHRFEIAGQSCAAVKRLYLHEEIRDAMIARIAALIEDVRTGDPADEATVMGTLIDEPAAARVERRVQARRRAGGEGRRWWQAPWNHVRADPSRRCSGRGRAGAQRDFPDRCSRCAASAIPNR